MKRRRRTEILIQGDHALAEKLASQIIEKYDCVDIVAPHLGITMIKMRESAQNSLFYLGEVLVTEAKVEINGKIGIGIVAGMEEKLAYHLAIIDAAYNANLKETKNWVSELLKEEERIEQKMKMEQAEILETKVDFETMEIQ